MTSEFVTETQIDAQLEGALGDASRGGLSLALEVVDEPTDRWYGQLVVTSYASLTDARDTEPVLSAATAIELLRGYVRLRSRLLARPLDERAHALRLDPGPALLAGDYLYTAAFSSLHSIPDTVSGDRFEILTNVLGTVTEAFARTYTPATPGELDHAAFLDETAGSIGEGAALLGATLAGVSHPDRRDFERLGHGFSTARQIDRVLDADPSDAMVAPPILDESELRRHAEQRRHEADQALGTLSATADVTPLRALAEGDESMKDRTRSDTDDDALY